MACGGQPKAKKITSLFVSEVETLEYADRISYTFDTLLLSLNLIIH